MFLLALFRAPIGTEQGRRASGPLERAEQGLSAARDRIAEVEARFQELANSMVATSLNEILARAGFAADGRQAAEQTCVGARVFDAASRGAANGGRIRATSMLQRCPTLWTHR